MKQIIIVFLLVCIFYSCENEREEVMVKYLVTNSNSGFTVSYKTPKGIIKQYVPTPNKNYKWSYSFSAVRGDIVYLTVLDTISASFPKAQIIIENKVFKEASRTNDSLMPVVVSGTIPF